MTIDNYIIQHIFSSNYNARSRAPRLNALAPLRYCRRRSLFCLARGSVVLLSGSVPSLPSRSVAVLRPRSGGARLGGRSRTSLLLFMLYARAVLSPSFPFCCIPPAANLRSANATAASPCSLALAPPGADIEARAELRSRKTY